MARRASSAFLLLLTFLLLPFAYADDKPCTGRNAGKFYDLNSLQSAKDYTMKTAQGHELVLSACKSVSHETWGLKVQDPGIVGGFVRRGHGDFSLGQINTTLSFSGRANYPHLTYKSGSKCLDSNGKTIENLRGSTEIEFICDPSAGKGNPRLIAQLPPGGDDEACAWVFEWRTAAACPTSEGITFGGVIWFLFISFLVLLALYLLIGTLYNFFALGLTGTDAFPRFSVASMMYHGQEAFNMAGEWWNSGRGDGFKFSSTARGPVGLGGPGGFPTSHHHQHAQGQAAQRDPEHGGFERSRSSSNGTNANPFIRSGASVRKERMPQPQPQPQTNPASHQTQVMQPGANVGAGMVPSNMPAPMGMPVPPSLSGAMGGGAELQGLNPASHQAQMMAGMPVPHLSSPSPGAAGPNTQNQNPNQNQSGENGNGSEKPQPTRRETGQSQTFAVGDDEEEDVGVEGQVQVADVRGRMGGGEGEGVIRL
ncbi:PLCXc domain-containing protein [Favolaschia claudopus]|uniref:Autophagy-related protein 27 n=1 Tax=Favolaschia claudopus TaxID=2862362 RepID=A0AAW0CB62_9AGAR